MKTKLLIAVFAIMSLFTSCVSSLSTATLNVTVVDLKGVKVEGAMVVLREKENTSNYISKMTNSSGLAKFEDIDALSYIVRVDYLCLNNGTYTTNKLSSGSSVSITSTIQERGEIFVTDETKDPYTIYVDGVIYSTIESYKEVEIPDVIIGSHTVRCVQNSGYVSKPADYTFKVTVTACEKSNIVL